MMKAWSQIKHILLIASKTDRIKIEKATVYNENMPGLKYTSIWTMGYNELHVYFQLQKKKKKNALLTQTHTHTKVKKNLQGW